MSETESGEIAANPDVLEVAPGSAHEDLQGWIASLDSEQDARDALERAFSYRGDVTITHKDGTKIEGYVFDRRTGATLADSAVRVIRNDTGEKLSIPYIAITGLSFTGRDTAAGKSWEAWIRKYWEKKAAGEKNIGLEPETLE